MTDLPPDSGVDGGADGQHQALVALHSLVRRPDDVDPGLHPGFRPLPPARALRAVAEASEADVPLSARLAALYDLAAAGFPHRDVADAEYRLLAESVAQRQQVDVDQLLGDLEQSAVRNAPFRSTPSGRQMPHHLVAFIGEDVCQVRKVEVGGLRATWIFSEFETDASFEHVVGWIDPRSWPERGPLLFKQMELVGGDQPVPIGQLGDDHWHGVFHEGVQIIDRIDTLLHCDYWRDGQRAAGMTYELDLSLDGAIDVDRGFLSVNDQGPVRRVKALKIVGFTNDVWDRVAATVCPFWTDWVRRAVEGGTTSSPQPSPEGPAGLPGRETLEAWIEFFGDSARTYFELFSDVTSRAMSPGYSTAEWLRDGTRYWSQIARDWAQAWTYGLDVLDDVAREGLDAGFMPPGTEPEAGRGIASAAVRPTSRRGEATSIPIVGLAADEYPVCSDLVSIEAGGASIPSRDVSVVVEDLGEGKRAVRLATTNTTVPPGLYVGALQKPDGAPISPVQLYVSRASGLGGS